MPGACGLLTGLGMQNDRHADKAAVQGTLLQLANQIYLWVDQVPAPEVITGNSNMLLRLQEIFWSILGELFSSPSPSASERHDGDTISRSYDETKFQADRTILELNTNAIRDIEKRMGRPIGVQEVVFSCTFDERSVARTARDLMREQYNLGLEDTRILTFTNGQDIKKADVLLSATLKVDARIVTEIELFMRNISAECNGGDVTWEFLETSRRMH